MPLPQWKIQAWILNFKLRFYAQNSILKPKKFNQLSIKIQTSTKNWVQTSKKTNGLTLLKLPKFRFNTKFNHITLPALIFFNLFLTTNSDPSCSFSHHCFKFLLRIPQLTLFKFLAEWFWIRNLRRPFSLFSSLIALFFDTPFLSLRSFSLSSISVCRK